MKILTQKFLKSLRGHTINEIKDSIFKLGFTLNIIKSEQETILSQIEDLVELSINEDGFISRATTSIRTQSV